MPFDVTFLSHPQPRDCGDYRHRTLWPAKALGELVPTVAVQTLHPDSFAAMLQCHLLVVGMVADPDVQAIVEERKARGLPTIYEISDDFKCFPSNTSLGSIFYDRPDVQAQIETLAQLCDGLQFSSPFLAQKYGHLNPQHIVFMNQAWELPGLPNAPQNETVRIGWTASGGHLEDAKALAKLFSEAFERDPKLAQELEICLMTAPQLAEAFTAQGLSIERTPTGSFESYMNFVSSLDGGIAHLQMDDFAQGRSDGKYIEFACRGVPMLCHNSGTFAHTIRHKANGLLYSNSEEFQIALSALVRQPRLRTHLRTQAVRNVREHRNHSYAAQERLAFYKQVVSQCDAEPSIRSPFAKGAFVSLEHPLESKLYNTLHSRNQNPSGETLREFFALSQELPDSWILWREFQGLYEMMGGVDYLEFLSTKAQESKENALARALQKAA